MKDLFVARKNKYRLVCWFFVLLGLSQTVSAIDVAQYPLLKTAQDQLIEEGFSAEELKQLFAQVEYKQNIIDAMTRPAEKSMNWTDYRGLFIKPERIDQGLEFWDRYAEEIQRAAKTYGVAEHVIVAIIGVESRFGRYRGKHAVFESLATLVAGYPRRSKFFASELRAFLLLCREQGLNPLSIKGSYAGAVGYPQFISSSYRAYGVDFSGDGRVDLINDPVDAIGSVANYFSRHGWRDGEPVTGEFLNYSTVLLNNTTSGLKVDRSVADIENTGAKLAGMLNPNLRVGVVSLNGRDGPVVRLAHHNFYVITKYNRSTMYAMAVHELGQAINQAKAGRDSTLNQ